MKGFTIFALSVSSVASLIIIGNFVRNMLAEAKPATTAKEG